VSVPGEGHEDVGDGEQRDGSHAGSFTLLILMKRVRERCRGENGVFQLCVSWRFFRPSGA
jgi:hypothetical protein